MFAYRVCQRLRDELRNTRGSVRTLDIFFSSFLFFANLKSNFPPITRFKGSTSLTSFFFSKSFYGSVKFHGSILVTRYVKVRG